MAFDPLEYVTPEDRADERGYVWYAADPGEFYPAILSLIHDTVVNQRRPLPVPRYNSDGDLIAVDPNPLQNNYDRAVQLPLSVWTQVQGLAEGDPLRVAVLEEGRLWFTELLHQKVNAPMGLHILKNDAWKQ